MRFCFLFLLSLIVVGCISKKYDDIYIDGTSTSLGLYIPYDGTLYGLQVCQYVSGTTMMMRSNSIPIRIERETSSTNSYFGIIKTNDKSKTKIEINN